MDGEGGVKEQHTEFMEQLTNERMCYALYNFRYQTEETPPRP